MVTNDERREIAERLRILSSHREVDQELVEDALGLYMGECVDGYDPVSVSELANLIEPEPGRTCKWNRSIGCGYCDGAYDSETDTFDSFPIVRHDFSCGHSAITESEKNIPHFCPECGARII